jgi:nicotinamidase-related amidase/GNAT superfamily N-acetyltransferase
MIVRVLSRDDAAVLERVGPDVFDRDVDRDAAVAYLADPRMHLAVGIDDGVVVGFASALHYHHPDKPRSQLWIDEVGVASTHRGRGIGKRVLEVMLAHAAELGCEEAWVLTEHDNVAAQRLYASVGMSPHETLMFSRTLERHVPAPPVRGLLVVDVLAGIFELPVPLHEPDHFLANVRGLVERARAAGAPVIHLQHLGLPGSRFGPGAAARELHASVAPRPGESVIEKSEPDGFHGTSLDEALRAHNVGELVVCGFATQDCVDTTVRSAFARGYRVVLARGAHTTTANAVLSAAQIVAHHDTVLARFAKVVDALAIDFAP